MAHCRSAPPANEPTRHSVVYQIIVGGQRAGAPPRRIHDDVNEGWLTFTQPWFETENQVGVISDGRLIIRTAERVILTRYD